MNAPKKSREEFKREIQSLSKQVTELKKYKDVFEAQGKLFRSILTMTNIASGRLMLRSILLEIVDFSRQLFECQEGSLFVLSSDGMIIESILARGPTMQQDKQRLIGEVLDKGLAGWVARHRQLALIEDTMKDERWVNLPGQPYKVRSALCIPFLRGNLLLGILTLTHSESKHFTKEMAEFMNIYAPSLAISLDHARIYIKDQKK